MSKTSPRFLVSALGLMIVACGGRTGLPGVDAGGGIPTIPADGAAGNTESAGGGAIPGSAGNAAGATGGAETGGGGMASGGAGASGSMVGGTSNGGQGGTSLITSTAPLSCKGVTCPVLPKTCKKVVQDPTACCAVCTDTGCPKCDPINCSAGMHSELVPGDCCPSCVADPPDACKKGQQTHAELSKQLLDKYSSSQCQNSQECTLVLVDDACATVCNVPVPTVMANSYKQNLASSAKKECASCAKRDPVLCERMVATCVNGKCLAVDPS